MPFREHDLEIAAGADRAPPPRVPAWVWALVSFLVGLSLTFWLTQNERHRVAIVEQQALANETSYIADAIGLELLHCGQILRGFQSILLASDGMTPEEYALAYEHLQVDLASRVSLRALAYAERRQTPAGVSYITTMFAPLPGNEGILGLDVGTQPANMAAIRRSRDTNDVAMSAPFHLRQSGPGDNTKDGFIVRLPDYAHGVVLNSVEARRASIIGSIGASFRLSDLVASTLNHAPAGIADLSIQDMSSGVPVLLHSQQFAEPARESSFSVPLEFGGRIWNIVAHARLQEDGMKSWMLVLWVGTAMSLLVAALTWSLVDTRERAVRLGNSMSAKFRTSEVRFRMLNELLPCLVLLARKDNGEIIYRNAAARHKLGPGLKDESLSPTLIEAISAYADLEEGDARCSVDLQMQDADAEPFWANTWVSSFEMDEIPMWLLVASDITEQRLLTERLSYQASHDSLTKLFNRREFEDRTQFLMGHPEGQNSALLFIDLDQFKVINDTSGHRAGDELLVQLAALMRQKLRPNDVVGRLGGDEFGVLLAGVPTVDAAMLAAERLRRNIEAFIFSWEQRTYTISASLGVVRLVDAASMKELFAHADAACYLAKEGGRNRIHVYAQDDSAITGRIGEMEWASRIRDAVRDDRLLLDYQELHYLKSQHEADVHVELLLRLRSEDGDVVFPGAFLPAAERYGLMPLIDQWVVETALNNIDRIHPQGTRLATCSINLSAASLEDTGLFERIQHLIELHKIDPSRLMFEITETMAMRNFAASSELVARLRALGCRVALDDFGVGMSSFGYLKNLELDVVKIDGSFIQALASDAMSQSIVKAIVEIGHQQGLLVVAEWVSSAAILDAVIAMKVDFAQGFALHRPERAMFQRHDLH